MKDSSQYTRSTYPGRGALRFLFLGMNGSFSEIPFKALLEEGYLPRAVVMPPPPGLQVAFRQLDLAILQPFRKDSIFALASQAGIPVYEIGSLKDTGCDPLLDGLDLVITACFPRLLPPRWLEAPGMGCLNLHPSLLPAYRGPNPVEDQLAAGETVTGITLHFMDETADTGDILLQESFPVPGGAGVDEVEREAARRGVSLLLRYLESPGEYLGRVQAA